MLRRLHRFVLRSFGQLPRSARRFAVRRLYPSFTVGSMCFVERDDGALLLVRHSYRKRWGVPGGLLSRGEDPITAGRREALEEVALDVEMLGEPAVVVDVPARRVDIVYRARPAPGTHLDGVRPSSPEIVEARWFAPHALPDLQQEARSALAALKRVTDERRSP